MKIISNILLVLAGAQLLIGPWVLAVYAAGGNSIFPYAIALTVTAITTIILCAITYDIGTR